MSLEQILATTAQKIASHGTQSESVILEELALAAGASCPGAAVALVDWNGPEIARLRAFGIVHRALVRQVAPVVEPQRVDSGPAATAPARAA